MVEIGCMLHQPLLIRVDTRLRQSVQCLNQYAFCFETGILFRETTHKIRYHIHDLHHSPIT